MPCEILLVVLVPGLLLRAAMQPEPLPRFDLETLHGRLCERLAELHPLVVADVTRIFLEVSSLPDEPMLWSLEFAFDEDDGRIARLEARFADRDDASGSDRELPGYVVELLLPRIIPALPALEDGSAATHVQGEKSAKRSLVARFLRALAELGAYRSIEGLEARSVDVDLL